MKYRERLLPSIGGFLAISLILPATWLVFSPFENLNAPLIAFGILAAAMLAVVQLAPRVVVKDDALTAGRITIPLSQLGKVEIYRGESRRKALGVELHARAQLCTSPWVDSVLKIEITDQLDPVPYLVVSTRRPESLKQALGK